ncbi:hypothetical protein L21SP4_00743 [Kiritimatiella glycovorans]|uniref:Uncharacterized protein n=1 Tax=Kiritimatiella glycovorans TaxID=1307763 RepID=A0A0G3EBZ6_9BACT|nr:hypothetical protein L21SP4_00743 [Kiritimatiella glycovorans]
MNLRIPVPREALPSFRPGDRVVAQGRKVMRNREPVLRVPSVRCLEIRPLRAIQWSGADPAALDRYAPVTASGRVTSVRIPARGLGRPWCLVLEERGVRVPVYFRASLYEAIPDRAALRRGARVRVRALRDRLEGQPALRLTDPEALRVLEHAEAGRRRFAAQWGPARVGATVTRTGRLCRLATPATGRNRPGLALFRDRTGYWSAVFWDPALAGSWRPGGWYRVRGTIELYRGEIEMRAGSAEAVR